MDDLGQHEYAALRATIRERGTVRAITFFVTVLAWAMIELAFLASRPHHVIGALLSLMVLAAGFETIFQLHLGVERVGRYLQAAYEERPEAPVGEPGALAAAVRPAWETTAMAYGKAYPAAGSDPLFTTMFLLATLVNLLPVLHVWRMPGVLVTLLLAHLLFVGRIRLARKRAGRQRGEDLARFRELVSPPGPR
jgi:hypothetical protein